MKSLCMCLHDNERRRKISLHNGRSQKNESSKRRWRTWCSLFRQAETYCHLEMIFLGQPGICMYNYYTIKIETVK